MFHAKLFSFVLIAQNSSNVDENGREQHLTLPCPNMLIVVSDLQLIELGENVCRSLEI